jgi:uncharacterized membrane protein
MNYSDILNKIASFGTCWYVQTLKMFGDTLHGSIVVAHYNTVKPKGIKLIWAMSERYVEEYHEYLSCDAKVALPHDMSNQERVELARAVEKLPNVKKVIKPLVGVWGWNIAGSIADNVFYNAGITKLNVPRKPLFPVGIQDYAWSDNIMRTNGLVGRKYGVLEYNSYSLSGPPHNAIHSVDWYNAILSKVNHPMVFTGGKDDPPLKYGIDLRGCLFRQAKVMIMRSKLMVGCGSGLTMVSCSDGVNVPVAEIDIGNTISMNGCGYGTSKIFSKPTPDQLASYINKMLS